MHTWTQKQNKRFHPDDDDWSVLKSVHPTKAREGKWGKMSSWCRSETTATERDTWRKRKRQTKKQRNGSRTRKIRRMIGLSISGIEQCFSVQWAFQWAFQKQDRCQDITRWWGCPRHKVDYNTGSRLVTSTSDLVPCLFSPRFGSASWPSHRKWYLIFC